MTGLTARNLRPGGPRRAARGAFADIAVFDAGEVDEAATFAQPIRPAKGIVTVIVNGTPVWQAGKPTGARPGRVLRRGG